MLLGHVSLPSFASGYLEFWVFIAASFALLKIVFFYCLVQSRPAGRTEWYQIGVQFLQGLCNFVLYILTFNLFDGVQDWFWIEDDS